MIRFILRNRQVRYVTQRHFSFPAMFLTFFPKVDTPLGIFTMIAVASMAGIAFKAGATSYGMVLSLYFIVCGFVELLREDY